MEEIIQIKVSGVLRDLIHDRIADGLYGTPDEYLRSLIREDYERTEEQKLARLVQQIRDGISADPSEFVELDIQELIAEARRDVAEES
ncbi:ribbon-helix-helix domain-containing protein [Lacunimicrobium album]